MHCLKCIHFLLDKTNRLRNPFHALNISTVYCYLTAVQQTTTATGTTTTTTTTSTTLKPQFHHPVQHDHLKRQHVQRTTQTTLSVKTTTLHRKQLRRSLVSRR